MHIGRVHLILISMMLIVSGMTIVAYAELFPTPGCRWKDYRQRTVIIQVNSTHQEMSWSIYAIRLVIDDLNVTNGDVSFDIKGSRSGSFAHYDSLDNTTLDGMAFPNVAPDFTVPAQDFTITIGLKNGDSTVIFHYTTQIAEQAEAPTPEDLAMAASIHALGTTVTELGLVVFVSLAVHLVYLWNKRQTRRNLLNPIHILMAIAMPIVTLLLPLGEGFASYPMGHSEDWIRVHYSLTEIVVERFTLIHFNPPVYTITYYNSDPYYSAIWIILSVLGSLILLLTAMGRLRSSLGLVLVFPIYYLQVMIPNIVINRFLSSFYGEQWITIYPAASLIALVGLALILAHNLIIDVRTIIPKKKTLPESEKRRPIIERIKQRISLAPLIARFDMTIAGFTLFLPFVVIPMVYSFGLIINGMFYYIIWSTSYTTYNLGLFIPPLFYYHDKILMLLLAILGIICNHGRMPWWVFLIGGIVVNSVLLLRFMLMSSIAIPTPIAFLVGLYILWKKQKLPERDVVIGNGHEESIS